MKDLDGPLPGVVLGGVEFAQVEDLALDDAVAAEAEAFADGVEGVGLAIFAAGAAFEKHAGSLTQPRRPPARG